MSNRLITPTAILSYPALFEPKAMPGQTTKKYGCTLVFEKGADLKPLRDAVMNAGRERWGEKFDTLVKTNKLWMPFKVTSPDDDKGYPEGSISVGCRTNTKPQLINHRKEAITDPADLYPGSRVRASVTVDAFEVKADGKVIKQGVTIYLNNIQKVADGPRLDSRVEADKEFDILPEPAADALEVL